MRALVSCVLSSKSCLEQTCGIVYVDMCHAMKERFLDGMGPQARKKTAMSCT